MEIEECPYCHIQVVICADGTCPSCRQSVRDTWLPGTKTTDKAPFADRDVVRQSPLTAMDPANPYAPPIVVETTVQRNASTQREGLVWILFSFEGRIPRRVFWGVTLLYTIAFYAFVIGLVAELGEDSLFVNLSILVMYPVMLWVSLAVTVKRWHDLDKSGWWVLIGLIPCLGPLWAFVETGCMRGTYGDNSYGPDPT